MIRVCAWCHENYERLRPGDHFCGLECRNEFEYFGIDGTAMTLAQPRACSFNNCGRSCAEGRTTCEKHDDPKRDG